MHEYSGGLRCLDAIDAGRSVDPPDRRSRVIHPRLRVMDRVLSRGRSIRLWSECGDLDWSFEPVQEDGHASVQYAFVGKVADVVLNRTATMAEGLRVAIRDLLAVLTAIFPGEAYRGRPCVTSGRWR